MPGEVRVPGAGESAGEVGGGGSCDGMRAAASHADTGCPDLRLGLEPLEHLQPRQPPVAILIQKVERHADHLPDHSEIVAPIELER